MSKLLIGQSYYLHFDPKLWEAMQPYPPLGTMYAASHMREQGYEVALFDAMLAESEDEWAQALEREQPKYAIIYEDNFNYLSKMCLLRMRQAAFTMIEIAKERGCTVIVGGSDASDHNANYLEKGADFVLIGEGEFTLVELLNSLEKHKDLSSILGLAYKDNGEIKTNPRRPDIKDLDSLPFPAWDLIDVARYRDIWVERHGYFSMNMVTTRGCPYHCNWCAKPIWGQRYNARSPDNVAKEMRWLKTEYAPDHIWFADDIFGLKPGWLPRFAEVVEELNAGIPFKCLNRADLLLREGEIEALAKAGCEITWIGAESGVQHILDAMDKGTQVEQIYEVCQAIHEAGFQVAFFLQFGYPGETRSDIEKTIQMVRDCQPDDIGISVSYPLPGTKFYKAVEDQLGSKQNWVDSSDLDMMYQGPFATDFYRKLHTLIHKEYRASKTWRRVKKGQRMTIRQLAVMAYYWLSLPLERLRLDRWLPSPMRALVHCHKFFPLKLLPNLPLKMNEEFNQVAEAFSRKALVYDEFGVDHENLTRMRQTVYEQVQSFLDPGDRILELNAGTGADAVHFAKQGFKVHATDISPGMVEQIKSKIDAGDTTRDLNPLLSVEQLSFTELDKVSKGPFQHIYSNFGGLNCIADMKQVTKHVPKLLEPGKLLTWVIMPRVTPWEWRAVLKSDWKTATRRLRKDGIRANVEGVEFQTYYFSPKDVMQALGPDFEIAKLQGLSIFAPPADNDGFAKRHPRLYKTLVAIDETFSQMPPFNGWGDFFILSARYSP